MSQTGILLWGSVSDSFLVVSHRTLLVGAAGAALAFARCVALVARQRRSKASAAPTTADASTRDDPPATTRRRSRQMFERYAKAGATTSRGARAITEAEVMVLLRDCGHEIHLSGDGRHDARYDDARASRGGDSAEESGGGDLVYSFEEFLEVRGWAIRKRVAPSSTDRALRVRVGCSWQSSAARRARGVGVDPSEGVVGSLVDSDPDRPPPPPDGAQP